MTDDEPKRKELIKTIFFSQYKDKYSMYWNKIVIVLAAPVSSQGYKTCEDLL